MKIGAKLRRHYQEGTSKGEAALEAIMENVELNEQETKHPRREANLQSLSRKKDNADDLDMMDLWEGCYGSVRSSALDDQGWEETKTLIEAAQFKAKLGLPLSEAEVLSTAFQRITAAKLFTTMRATYELTPAVFEQLFGVFNSPYARFDHVIPSDAPVPEFTKEGEDYKTGTLEDRFSTTKANKFGKILNLTRETIITDRAGQVQEQANQLAEATKKLEDRLASLAWIDSSNSALVPEPAEQDAGAYHPEDTQVALYRTAAGTTKVKYETAINAATGNSLLHWDNIAVMIRLMMKITNPISGQLIEVVTGGRYKLVVPTDIWHRAMLLEGQMSGGHVDLHQNEAAGTAFNISRIPKPLRQMGINQFSVILWKELPNNGDASVWYLAGDSEKQFRKHQRWGTEFNRASAAQLGGDDFTKDVIMKVRGGFNAGFRAVDDKFVFRSTG